jgi:hypothetical protein
MGAFLERKRQAKAARTQRLSRLCAAAQALAVYIGVIARAAMVDKPRLETVALGELADRFNTALAEVRLLETTKIINAANALDNKLIELGSKASTDVWGRHNWPAVRDNTVGSEVAELQRIARDALRSKSF